MNFKSLDAKQWSRMGPRAMFGQFMMNIAKKNKKLMVLSADLGRSSGLARFKVEFPDQYLSVGISEQNLVDCATNYSCMGCDGGWPDKAMQYVIDNKGLDTESSYPYQGTDNDCQYNKSMVGATIHNYTMLPAGNMSVLYEAIATVGPISVALDAEYDFQMYSSGIFESTACSSEQLDHAVLAVGYGVSASGKKYLIIKNSWDTVWGMDGYIYFSTDIDDMCGISQHSSYPIV